MHYTLDAVIDVFPHEADAKMKLCLHEIYWGVHGGARPVGRGKGNCDAVTAQAASPIGSSRALLKYSTSRPEDRALTPCHPPVIGCGLTLADEDPGLQVRAIPERGSPSECCQPSTLPALGGGMRAPAWAGPLWPLLQALNKWSSFSLLMDINRSAYSLHWLVADFHPGPCPDLVGTCNIQVFGHSTHWGGWEQTFIDSQARGMGWDWHYYVMLTDVGGWS